MEMNGQLHTWPFYPWKEFQYPLNRSLGRPQSWSGRLEEDKTAGHPARSPAAIWTALPKPTDKTHLL